MNNIVFEKSMKNVRKPKDTKLVTTEAGNNDLISEPNYHTKEIEMNINRIEMKKQHKYS